MSIFLTPIRYLIKNNKYIIIYYRILYCEVQTAIQTLQSTYSNVKIKCLHLFEF